MDESVITSSLVKALSAAMPGGIGFKHFDVSTDGIPDLSYTWAKRTLWVEVKFGEGEVRPGQIITMRRLSQIGLAYYVRFGFQLDGQPHTRVSSAFTFRNAAVEGEWTCRNHDVNAVAEYLRSVILQENVRWATKA